MATIIGLKIVWLVDLLVHRYRDALLAFSPPLARVCYAIFALYSTLCNVSREFKYAIHTHAHDLSRRTQYSVFLFLRMCVLLLLLLLSYLFNDSLIKSNRIELKARVHELWPIFLSLSLSIHDMCARHELELLRISQFYMPRNVWMLTKIPGKHYNVCLCFLII